MIAFLLAIAVLLLASVLLPAVREKREASFNVRSVPVGVSIGPDRLRSHGRVRGVMPGISARLTRQRSL